MTTLDDIKKEQHLATYQGEDRVEPGDILLEYARKKNPVSISVETRLSSLDRILGPLEAGELTVISGPTGSGKTTLCRSLTMSFAEQTMPSLWFSFEMPWKQFLLKFHEDYLPRFYGPLTLTQKSVTWIEERIIEAKLKYGVSIVFVDHLHFLLDLARVKHASIEIGEIVRSLKLLALKHNLIFFLIAHTIKVREDREFGLGDVRDSGLIEAEADNSLYIWRDKKQENRSILKIAKNRKHGIIEKKIPLILTREHGVERHYEEAKE